LKLIEIVKKASIDKGNQDIRKFSNLQSRAQTFFLYCSVILLETIIKVVTSFWKEETISL